jgi:PAS domain S-box-containing protein
MLKTADRSPNECAVQAAIAKIFREALACGTEEDLVRTCLAVAEELTQSRFGFIGEINRRTGRLDDIAISDPGWEACRMPMRTGRGRRPLVSLEIHGIYGRVLVDGKGLFTNDASSHPDSIGTPPGHPPLRSFLGVPLIHAGETMGMIGLGNRDGGYGPEELERLEGLASAIVQAFLGKRAETALRMNEQRLGGIVASAMDAIVSVDEDQRIRLFNPAAVRMFGLDAAEAIGQPLSRLLPERFRATHEIHVRRFAETGATTRRMGTLGEISGLRADGDEFPIDASISQTRVDGAETLTVILRDISERKQAENALRDIEQRLRLALDSAYLISFEWDIQHDQVRRHISTDPVLTPTEEMAPGTFAEVRQVVHPEDRDQFDANVQVALESEDGCYESEFRLLHPDGQVVWLHETGRVERDPRGRPAKLIGLSQDITERKREESALRQEQAKMDSVMQATDVMLVLLDPDFNFVWVNTAYARTCRMRPQEMVGKNHFSLYPSDENEAIFRRVRDTGQAVFYKDKPFEFPDQPERGVTYWDWSLTPVKAPNGAVSGLVCSLRETTRYKRTEQALQASEARFRELVQNANSAIIRWNRNGTITYFNEYAERFFGWPTEEAIGRHVGILVPDTETTGADLTGLLENIVLHPERYVNNVNENVRRDGRRVWMNWTNRAIRDDSGEITEILAIGNDITALKRAEEALREADRSKDELLATLAHELRNPLTPICNAVEILKLQGVPEATAQTARAMIERQVAHMVRLIDDLLDVSRINRGTLRLQKERIELAAVLTQTLEASRPLIERAGHLLKLSLPPRPIYLEADPIRLAQVFSNLIDNASKFTAKGGRIGVSAECVGTEVWVKVEDSGIGIAAEHLPGIFETFTQVPSTPGHTQPGLGIGLALARMLVEMHGGRIEARSEGVGKGSELIVRLTAAQPPEPQAAPQEKPEMQATVARRILVVDDQEDIVQSLAILLRAYGNEVQTAKNGREALEAAQAFRPDLVLLDVGMPGLDGYATCRRMREQPWGKDLVIIALTGWGQESDRRKTKEADFDDHLVKPVAPATLVDVLAKATDRRA